MSSRCTRISAPSPIHMRIAALVLVLGTIGCSDAQRIADASGVIRTNAESSKQRFQRVETSALAANDRQVATDARAGVKEQVTIIGATEAIVRALPGVKDVTPWWANLLSWGLIALSVVGVVALLWMTGIGSFVRRLFAALGLFIPAGERREANIAAKALYDDNDATLREWIAVRRAQDPMFDAAYRRESRDRKIRTADARRRKPAAD